MIVKKLAKILEERRKELNNIIKRGNYSEEIKQQLKGAILEVNIMLRLLEDYIDSEVEYEVRNSKILKKEQAESWFSKLVGKRKLEEENRMQKI